MPPDPQNLDFSAVLPDRPIRVRPPTTVGPASAAGLFILLVGLIVAALAWLGPDLARDWRIGRDLVPAREAKLEAVSCGTRVFVIKACEVRFSAPTFRANAFWYLFLGRGDEPGVVLLNERSAPELLTSDLGQARLLARTLTLLAILVLLAWCIHLSAQVVRQGAAARRALATLDGQRLRAIVVAVQDSFTVAHKRRRWAYVAGEGGHERRGVVELHADDAPLFVTPDRRYALAAAGPAGSTPLLLDTKLKALDLSEPEREAFYAACQRVLGTDAGGGASAV